jgi:hypothetical protein
VSKLILVKPLWPSELGDNLFKFAYPSVFQLLRKLAAKEGIFLEPWDKKPLESADCIWFLELPDKYSDYEKARLRTRKGVPFLLQIMETPADRSQSFHPKNHLLFDYLITYHQKPAKADNCFSYRLPNLFRECPDKNKSFLSRKCSVMINSNRMTGWLATRKAGFAGLPGFGPFFSGWHRPRWAIFYPGRGELYSWRRRLARVAETRPSTSLEVYGNGWNGECISWNRFLNRQPFRNRVSGGVDDKLELLPNYRFTIATENFRGGVDYISEKIFDPMMAGSVPVYLGEEKIHEVIPNEAFVDVRKFKDQSELLNYLETCPESEWQKMHEAGQDYLHSKAAYEFSQEAFVIRMLEILKIATKQNNPISLSL